MSLFEGYERSFLLEFFYAYMKVYMCVIMCEDSFKKCFPQNVSFLTSSRQHKKDWSFYCEIGFFFVKNHSRWYLQSILFKKIVYRTQIYKFKCFIKFSLIPNFSFLLIPWNSVMRFLFSSYSSFHSFHVYNLP